MLFALDTRLAQESRLPRLADNETLTWGELGWLTMMGCAAAALTTFFDFSLRVPGHAVIRVAIPLSLGLAVVPRRGAGSYMGICAILCWGAIRVLSPAAESGSSVGALTSLTLFGPVLEGMLRLIRRGKTMLIPFALAGLTCNVLAFLVRGTFKFFAVEHPGARLLKQWLSVAIFSYALCGLIAGLLAAALFFRVGTKAEET